MTSSNKRPVVGKESGRDGEHFDRMSDMGVKEGNMEAHVMDYQKPSKTYSQEQFGKTLHYVERKDEQEGTWAKEIDKQSYKGRYS